MAEGILIKEAARGNEAPSTSAAPLNLDFIDALKAIAILLVIFLHTYQFVPGISGIAIDIAETGRLGVQLFFILSAFTLCRSMERRHEDDDHMPFYIRRAFRIAPLYWVGILVYATGTFIFDPARFAEFYQPIPIALNFLLLHGLWPDGNNTIVPGGWSIGTEVVFYAIFPFLFQWITTSARAFIVAGSVFLLHMIGRGVWASLSKEPALIPLDTFDYFFLLNQIPVFLTGIGIYHLVQSSPPWLDKTGYWWVVAVAGFAFLALVIMPSVGNGTYAPIFAAITFGCLTLAVRKVKKFAFVLLDIGRKSFSMYVFHFVFAWMLIPRLMKKLDAVLAYPYLNFALSFILTVGLSYAVASLTFKFIEQPANDWGRRIAKRWSLRRDAASA